MKARCLEAVITCLNLLNFSGIVSIIYVDFAESIKANVRFSYLCYAVVTSIAARITSDIFHC